MKKIPWKTVYQFLEVGKPKQLAKMSEMKFRTEWLKWCDDDDRMLTNKQIESFHWLANNHKNIKVILHDFSMSDHHLGGDDVIDIVKMVINAERKGFKIHTWYGENTEVLVIGIKDDA